MPNQYKNKVIYGDSVLMDITDTTAEAGDVASGAVFYAKNGARTVGTFTQAQSDWIEDDNTDPAFILNKPPIIAGDGEGSAVENQIEPDDDAAVYTLLITGEANATTFTYTTSDTFSSSIKLLRNSTTDYIKSNGTHVRSAIAGLNTTNQTITLGNSLSTAAITNEELKIYYGYHKAAGNYSHAEGFHASAVGNYAHAEGYRSKATGTYSHVEGSNTFAFGTGSHAEGYMSQAIKSYSHAEGYNTKALENYSHSEGYGSTAGHTSAHAEGYGTYAYGQGSHTEGVGTDARGNGSHAEGYGSSAYGNMSHAEGGYIYYVVNLTGSANTLTYTITDSTISAVDAGAITGSIVNTTSSWTINKPVIQSVTFGDAVSVGRIITTITLDQTLDASSDVSGPYYILVPNQAIAVSAHVEGAGNLAKGSLSHAEGRAVAASGSASHAEGISVWANAQAAHAEGLSTVASSANQHVQGKFNIEDSSDVYADIVGNGSSSARSNAYTLDWNGNGWFAGKVTVGAAPVNNMDVATKQYVDNAIVQSDWNETDSTDPSYILNKPTIDVSLDDSSSNAVQNSVVTTALNNKQSSAIYGSANTGSSSFITPYMVAVYTAGDDHRDVIVTYTDPTYGVLEFSSWSIASSFSIIASSIIINYNGLLCVTLAGNTSSPSVNNWGFNVYPIQDALTFDSTPTNNSTNPVTSGGIYTALFGKANNADIPSASTSAPLVDGASAVVGTSTAYARADHVHPKITQTISMSNNVITLTGSDGSTSSVTLPVYNGGVQTVS